MNLISVDPGNTTGWAAFSGTSLVEARTTTSDELFGGGLPGWMGSLPLVLIELPQHVKAPVMDLITLAVGVGEYKRFYEGQGCCVELVWPRTWKGTVPKKIHNQRVLAALTPAELAVVPKRPKAKDVDHNTCDAIGLGLWKLGRMR